MQLWKKNYLLTFTLFLVILSAGMITLVCWLFQEGYQQAIQDTIIQKNTLKKILKNQIDDDINGAELNLTAFGLKNNGQYFRLTGSDESITFIDTLPIEYANTTARSMNLVKKNDRPYFIISDSIKTMTATYGFLFAKDITAMYEAQQLKIILVVATSLIIILLVGVLLYVSLKKLYTPVNNIAHELRTPLTSIQGYAQYLVAGRLTEEDRFFASEQLLKESQNLRDIIDKLLIMGNLREGKIKTKKINLHSLLDEMKKQYPTIDIENRIHTMTGDETLIRSLLTNLTANAYRAGDQVKIRTTNRSILVWNNGEPIEKNKLAALNGKQWLAGSQVDGNGYGVGICHEIVKLHRGKLKFTSSKTEGTTASIEFPAKIFNSF